MAVQSARRFICQNQFGLIDDCPGASTSLLLTARHLIGIFVKNIRDVQLSGYFSYPTINLTCGNSIDCQCQSNILANGQSVQQVKVLKHKSKVLPAKPGNLLFIDFRHIGSIQIDMPCADRINSGNAVEQSGLAGTGCPHNPHKFPFLNRKANILNCFCGWLCCCSLRPKRPLGKASHTKQ